MQPLRNAADISLYTVLLTIFTVLLAACGGGGGGSGDTNQSSGIIQLSADVYEATEGSTLNIRVSRSGGSSGSASVDYATTTGSALDGSDYADASGRLTWANNVSGNRTISIRISDDLVAEPSESFTVTLSDPTGASLGVNTSASVTIIDNDTASLSAIGAITKLDSATVNGVRYDTDAAVVTINGQPGNVSGLELGQIVSVSGDANLSTRIGSADMISYDATVIGPVEHVDGLERRLIVLGQTIVTNADTVFGENIDADTLDGIAPGIIVQISGFIDHLGEIVASRIEQDPEATQVQLIGSVEGLDLINSLFAVNRLVVDFGSATSIDLINGLPAAGQRVLIRGALVDAVLLVESIKDLRDLALLPGDLFRFSGLVTRFDSLLDFAFSGTPAATHASTSFVNGSSTDLRLAEEISIQGEMGTDALMVDELVFGRLSSPRSTSSFDFAGFTDLSVSGLATVVVRQDPAYSVAVTAGPDVNADLVAFQDGATVSLGSDSTRIFHAQITMPVLDSISVQSGSIADVTLSDFNQMQMDIFLSGVSALSGERLMIPALNATVSGVSSLDLGNSHPTQGAHIDISGVSSATLNMDLGANVTGSVTTGQGTGVSRLYYYGTNVDVDLTRDSKSRIIRLGGTRYLQ